MKKEPNEGTINTMERLPYISNMGALKENYFESRLGVKSSNRGKMIQVIDVDDNISVCIRTNEEKKTLEIITVVDSKIAQVIGETSIREDLDRSSPKISAGIVFEHNDIKHIPVSRLALMCNCIKIPSDYDIHHKNYYRDNRINAIEVLTKEQHGKLHGPGKTSLIKNDEEFKEYIRTEVLQVDKSTFNRILLDLYTLGRMYKNHSGVYLNGVNLRDTPLSEIKDNIDEYVTLSKR